MAETNCGKSCVECTYREELNCPGCKAGPGKPYGGECELARCCRGKGHEVCQTCNLQNGCNHYRGRERMPEYRLRHIQAQKAHYEAVSKRAPVLGRWLWILFWLMVPTNIAGLMTDDNVVKLLPQLYTPGVILEAACALAYGLILLKLSGIEEKYRTAAICTMITGGISLLLSALPSGDTGSLLLAIPSAIAAIVGVCYEFPAHSKVLEGVDNDLSDKWMGLRKWYIISLALTLGSILVILIIPVLGLLVLLAGGISALVVTITKLVYLYRTAKVFRAW